VEKSSSSGHVGVRRQSDADGNWTICTFSVTSVVNSIKGDISGVVLLGNITMFVISMCNDKLPQFSEVT
jgi:hypothetical protein